MKLRIPGCAKANAEINVLKDNGEKVLASVPKQDPLFMARLNDLVVTTLIDTFVREKKANSKVVLESAERFGRNIFRECVGERKIWTPYDWVTECITKVFNRQGTGVTFTLKEDVTAIIHKCPTPERARISPEVACAFSWGYVRGLWKSAFPDGEAVIRSTMALGYPTCEFVFKVKADENDEKAINDVREILHKVSEPKL